MQAPVAVLGAASIAGVAAALVAAGPGLGIGLTASAVGGYAVLRHSRMDLTTGICAILLVPLLVPAQLRVEPLSAAGTPAALAGVAAFLVWAYAFATGRSWLARGRQPARWPIAAVAVSVLASYVAMGFRSPDPLEARAGDRGVLTVVSMAGILLLTADGIRGRAELRRILQAVVTGGGVVAGLGIAQFATGVDIASRVRLPGFSYVSAGYDPSRAGFHRIVSTASHPIELSVVLVLLLPLALHVAFTSPPKERLRWWACTAAIGAATPMTVSRTAVVALAVAAIVLVPAWSGARRRVVAFGALAGLVVMKFAVPGLIGTLRAMLFNPGADPSLGSRETARDHAIGFVLQRPLLGRGFQTFVPTRYEFLDNQVLLSAVETGLVGLLALLAIPLVTTWQVGDARRHSGRDGDRDLAQALLACVLVGHVTWLTFDGLSFATSRSLALFTAGAAAALWRIVRLEPSGPAPAPRVVPRHWAHGRAHGLPPAAIQGR